MMMIVLHLLSLLGLKSRWHRHFSPRPLNKVYFQGWLSVDSWTLGPKPLCHRHPTGPHPSGLLWTPAKGDSTKRNFALGLHLPLQHHLVDAQHGRAVVRAPAHALGEALEVVGGRPLLQRHTQLVAELEGEMQVLVGEVEREGGRRVVALQRPQGEVLDGV